MDDLSVSEAVQSLRKELSASKEREKALVGLLSDLARVHQQNEDLSFLMHRVEQARQAHISDSTSLPSGEEGFMCATDFDCELGSARGGVPVYSSLEDLCEARSCIKQCGVARVRVVLMEWVKEPDFSDLFANAARRRVPLRPLTESASLITAAKDPKENSSVVKAVKEGMLDAFKLYTALILAPFEILRDFVLRRNRFEYRQN